jgi:hypothetical protein
MKPSKSDFPAFVKFPLNISDADINIHIDAAYKYEVKPKLETLASDILSYDQTLTTKPQLKAFFNDYVLEWWVLLAYRRFLQTHGRNVTQFGYTKTKDPQGTFDQLDGEERAVILKQLTHDAAVCFNYMLQQTWTFDTVAYRKYGGNCSTRTSEGYGINALE